MSLSINDMKDPIEQLIDSAPLPQYPCVPRAAVAEQAPVAPVAPVCPKCNGEGVTHTGIEESPTTQCGKCDGTGLAPLPAAPAPTAVEQLSQRLEKMGVTNFGFTSGSNPNATPEQIAAAISGALDQIDAGPAPTDEQGLTSNSLDVHGGVNLTVKTEQADQAPSAVSGMPDLAKGGA